MFAETAAPPMNLPGLELVSDLITLIQQVEADQAVRALIFRSADPPYFISHVDMTVKEVRDEVANTADS